MHSHVTSHALTMSSTPFTLVGCMILILWAFFDETQCSSPSSSNNWICPVSENFTIAPIGTSNSPPVVWSSQTWSPYSGDRYADSWVDIMAVSCADPTGQDIGTGIVAIRSTHTICSLCTYRRRRQTWTDTNITLCTQCLRSSFLQFKGGGAPFI